MAIHNPPSIDDFEELRRKGKESVDTAVDYLSALLSQMPPGRKRHQSDGVSVLLSARKGKVDWRALLRAHGVTLTESQIDAYRNPSVESVIVRDQLGAPLSIPALPAVKNPHTVPPTAHSGQPASQPTTQDLKRDFIF